MFPKEFTDLFLLINDATYNIAQYNVGSMCFYDLKKKIYEMYLIWSF